MENLSQTLLTPLIAGGVAGLSVDVILYPADTLKTRLQSAAGFQRAGGFSGVYRGLGAVVVGSVPTAALFFLSYELFKGSVTPLAPVSCAPIVHMAAASVGEVVACLIRVPTEIAKQRQQTLSGQSGMRVLAQAWKTEGFRRGLYRGFLSTVMRDLPFSFLQFPLWEYFKSVVASYSVSGQISSLEVALCGSVSGAIAGALTTPLDVAKTRIMLADANSVTARQSVRRVLAGVYRTAGVAGLTAGLIPRVLSFTLGGAIFFGAYDVTKNTCNTWFE